MFIPPQGFRHAATLLLTNGIRAVPQDASPQAVASALARLADELVALAGDMRASADVKDWLIDEYDRTIERLSYAFDVEAAKSHARGIIARVGAATGEIARRDLFLIYVSQDRLPLAAPLAIELTKRRVSVAFSEYEITSQEDLAKAVAHGLANHVAGVVLRTPAFERAGLRAEPLLTDRLRLLSRPDEATTVGALASWITRLRTENVKNPDIVG